MNVHDLAVPGDFHAHMEASAFAPPRLTEGEVREVFVDAKQALSFEPRVGTARERLLILDVRDVHDDSVVCTARAEGGSLREGQKLWNLPYGDALTIGKITGSAGRLGHLSDGQTARVTLVGPGFGQVAAGAVLIVSEK
ncbi:hypothetical protein [Micromonospora sp. NPDC049171]|uniref:hypothetical protein n=1 Tax=Micromonospora sp. NPDC049171 TaxID=3155770 RepID=UPI00340C5BDD